MHSRRRSVTERPATYPTTAAPPLRINPTPPEEAPGNNRPSGSGKKQLGAFGDGQVIQGQVVLGTEPAAEPSLELSLGLPSLELSLGLPSSSSGSNHGFGTRIIYVDAGEDIAARIMAFSREICTSFSIICASGFVRAVTLSGVPIPREGPFEIITLSGSFILEEGGDIGVHGALMVCLAGSDHRPFGGTVAGALIAATPVQVNVGTFARG